MRLLTKTVDKSTHLLRFDVLMKDLSATSIEVRFNGWHAYDQTGSSPLEAASFFYQALSKSLDSDNDTLGWKVLLFNLASDKVVAEYEPYIKYVSTLS